MSKAIEYIWGCPKCGEFNSVDIPYEGEECQKCGYYMSGDDEIEYDEIEYVYK